MDSKANIAYQPMTNWSATRSTVSIAALTLWGFFASAGQAHALYVSSEAYLHSNAFTTSPVTDGGPDALTASVSDFGSIVGVDSTSNVTASSNGTAQGGHLELDLEMTTSVSASAPQNRYSAFVLGRAEASDWFHVGAGTSGLSN